MAINRDSKVTDEHFVGSGRVFGRAGTEPGHLAELVRNGLIREAKDRVRARNLADLTDNSGGVAGLTFTGANATEIITVTPLQPNIKTGDGPYRLSGADLPLNLTATTDYYLRSLDTTGTTFNLHLTKSAALGADAPVAFDDDGTPPHAILALVEATRAPEATIVGVTTGVTTASMDASADDIMDSYAVLMERVNEVRALVNAGSLDEGPGTIAASGTIAVHDVDVANNSNNTDGTTYASYRAIEDELLAAEQTLVHAVNDVRAAVGLGTVPFTGLRKGRADADLDINGGAAITNAVATADAAGAASSVLEAAVELLLLVFQDNVAFLATQVDEVTDAASAIVTIVGPIYVDTTDFAAGNDVPFVSPISGRITGLRTQITDEDVSATTPNLTIDVAGSAVTGASVAIGSAAAIGVVDFDAVSGVIAPGTANSNYIAKGQTGNVQTDADATTGACFVWVEITETREDTGGLVTGFGDDPIDHRAS